MENIINCKYQNYCDMKLSDTILKYESLFKNKKRQTNKAKLNNNYVRILEFQFLKFKKFSKKGPIKMLVKLYYIVTYY